MVNNCVYATNKKTNLINYNLFLCFLFKCPSDCNGKICISPAPRVERRKGPQVCINLDGLTTDTRFPCNNNAFKKCTSNYPGQCPKTHRCCFYSCGGVCIQV